jgi:hypothetical protein
MADDYENGYDAGKDEPDFSVQIGDEPPPPPLTYDRTRPTSFPTSMSEEGRAIRKVVAQLREHKSSKVD